MVITRVSYLKKSKLKQGEKESKNPMIWARTHLCKSFSLKAMHIVFISSNLCICELLPCDLSIPQFSQL